MGFNSAFEGLSVKSPRQPINIEASNALPGVTLEGEMRCDLTGKIMSPHNRSIIS